MENGQCFAGENVPSRTLVLVCGARLGSAYLRPAGLWGESEPPAALAPATRVPSRAPARALPSCPLGLVPRCPCVCPVRQRSLHSPRSPVSQAGMLFLRGKKQKEVKPLGLRGTTWNFLPEVTTASEGEPEQPGCGFVVWLLPACRAGNTTPPV